MMYSCRLLLGPLVLLAGTNDACSQSAQPIGGGCQNRWAPAVSGPLTIGQPLQIDAVGCFTGQGGFGVFLVGVPLPQAAWIPLSLRSSMGGLENCLLVVQPLVVLDASAFQNPVRILIPNDPTLRGVPIGLQSLCNECGFGGCYEVMSQGLEVVFG
ncbi:MAG: hypothetical protein H6834_12080 [Planctomycetes bacterium]|nr:hypothetical protein [Planctomycetota bacterium]